MENKKTKKQKNKQANKQKNNGRNFRPKKFLSKSLFPYRQKIYFQELWQIFQLWIFVLRREKCHYQSHWIRNFRFFFSYFGSLPLVGNFERHSQKKIRIFQCFSCQNSRKFRQTTLDWEWWRLDKVARKASDEAAADWRYHIRTKCSYFFTCVITAFLRAWNPRKTPQFLW